MFAGLPSHPWAWPVLEIVHTLGIALLLGNLVLFELRVFGRAPELAVLPLARIALTTAATGFLLAAASGLLMFAGQPGELLANRAFTLKMLLIFAAGCNAAWFHGRGSLARCDVPARVLLAVSSLLWLAVLACGRWIAYL